MKKNLDYYYKHAISLNEFLSVYFGQNEFMDKKNQKVYVNEPNTIPGSLAFYLWEPIGKSYEYLLDDMINIAIKDYKNKLKKTYSFENNILSNYNGVKGLKGKLKNR